MSELRSDRQAGVSEFELPCATCGGSLVRRELPGERLRTPVTVDRPVVVAECRGCGGRYFPRQTLTELSN
ncbi:DUF7479 domain-containing protein [Haloarchaeobius sp. TZWWS8]|uniref:DUF7479 domain-containing protein n=1 Tax=Haloarchaeobius sp. TZWWS8 TaxID=3446121 RepID=UPI003EBBA1FF